MSKIAKFYENFQKSFRPKNAKKTAKKATSVFLASLLTITYISSSRFNENAQIEAAAKWLGGIQIETPSNVIATFEGEYNPKNPQKYIQLNNSEYSITYKPGSPQTSLTDENGNITLPPGTYKCKDFHVKQTARFRIQEPSEGSTTKQEVTLWLEGNNEFHGINGASRASDPMTTENNTKYGGGAAGGTAGIYLPEKAKLYIRGNGNISATGGNGAQGVNASNGCFIDLYKKCKGISDYTSDNNYSLTGISSLLYNDMNKPCSDLKTLGELNSGAGTGAGGSGGGGGGSAIGTDGTDGGKGGKGFETYKDLDQAFRDGNTDSSTSLETWLNNAHDTNNPNVIKKRVKIENKNGDGASSRQSSNCGTVYFLNKGSTTLKKGTGGTGGLAGQGMPNRNVTEKFRILGGGYGNYASGRNDEDYNYHYLERLGGLRLLLGAGGGGGGNGSAGKQIGSGGTGGGGGGAGGLGAGEFHLGLMENVGQDEPFYRPVEKNKEICTNDTRFNPNGTLVPCCGYAYGNHNREYGHAYGPLIYHFNVNGDDAKAYYPFACNGGGGGGAGGGGGVGGGGSGGYINYVSRRQSFDPIIPHSDYLNRATHTQTFWTWRMDHYKDFAPNWGLGGDPYSESTSYRTTDSPYVTTTEFNKYKDEIVKFRDRNPGETKDDPLKFLLSTDSHSSDTTYNGQYSYTNPTKYYIRNDNQSAYSYYGNCYEPIPGKVCKITNDSGKDGGNAVLRYRTNVNGDTGDKQCSCFYNMEEDPYNNRQLKECAAYPIYPTAWGGEAGESRGKDENQGGRGGSGKNVTQHNKYYYNQEWKQWNDHNGIHDKGPGSFHQDKNDSKDPVGVGCSAEGFDGNKGGDKATDKKQGTGTGGDGSSVYYSDISGYKGNADKKGHAIFDASSITLEMYMTDKNFTVNTNQKISDISWKVGDTTSKNLSQIPFDESYFGKEIALSYIPRREVKQEDGTVTYEKYNKDDIYLGNLSTDDKESIIYDKSGKLESITIKHTFNFKFAECDWTQTNDMLTKKDDNSTYEATKSVYPYYEAKYTSLRTIPSLEFSYGETKLVEGKHYDLKFYLAKTDYTKNPSSWTKVNPLGETSEEIKAIASTTIENEKITTAASQLENMPQYSKMTTLSTEVADRIVVEFIPKDGFTDDERKTSPVVLTYSIVQASLSEDNISITLEPKTIEYDGEDHNTPAARDKFSIGVYIRDVFRNLNKDEFDISWPKSNNASEDKQCINVGDYEVAIIPKASTGFKGAARAIFTIIPYDIGAEKTAYKLELEKTEFDFAEEKSPKPAVKVLRNDGASQSDDPLKLTENDYIVEYHDAEQNEDGSYKELSESAGKKVVVVKGKNPYSYNKESTENSDCNFTGMLTATYNVNGTDINSSDINTSLSPENFTYNGNEQKPEIIVTRLKNGVNTSLAEGENKDYTVSWPDDDYKNTGTKKVIVKGNGKQGYTGEKEMTYKINPVEYDSKSSDWEMTITPDSFYYNGTKLVPKVTVKHKGTTLEENTDYTLEYSDDSIDAGDKIITVNLKGNYTGKKELSYKIYNISYDTTYGDGLDASLYDIISKDYNVSNADLKIEKIVNSEGTSESTDLNKYIYIEGGNLKVSSSAPANKYVISIKNNNNNNSIPPFYVNLSIAKAVPELSIKDKTTLYTGKGITIDDIVLKFKNNENFGQIKDIVNFDYYTDKNCTSLVKDTPVNVGTYYVKAYVKAPSANYENVTSNVATLTIQKATQNLTGSRSYSGYPGSWIQTDTKTDANTKLTYKSSDDSIVQVDSEGKMLLMKDGTTTVTTIAEGTENYESATFESKIVVDQTLNSITAEGKPITDTIENNNSGNNGGTSGGNNNGNSSNSGSGSNSSGSSSSSSENNSSQNGSSSQDGNSSSDNQEEEKKSGLPLVADKFWSTILNTGDKSVYIISIAMVSIAIALTILVVLKRKDKDE